MWRSRLCATGAETCSAAVPRYPGDRGFACEALEWAWEPNGNGKPVGSRAERKRSVRMSLRVKPVSKTCESKRLPWRTFF